jgi:hypothetical protein
MQILGRPLVRVLLATGMSVVLGAVSATSALAQDPARTERTNGRVVSYDKSKGTLTIREKGKEISFHVTAEGPVLSRTSVTQNARPAKLDDIQPNAVVVVYWRPNASHPEQKDARKIDMPNIPKDLEQDEGE